MLAWMLLLHIGNPFQEAVDVLETNHVYDKRGEHCFTQVIAWQYDAADGRLHSTGWRFVRFHCDRVHKVPGGYFVKHERGFVTAPRHIERRLNFDIEREDSQTFWKNEGPNVFMEVGR